MLSKGVFSKLSGSGGDLSESVMRSKALRGGKKGGIFRFDEELCEK